MASEREIFSVTVPSFLTTIDWNNAYHKRSVAASLVQGVYNLDNDRRRNLHRAPPWWQFFNFRLVRVLVDEHDVSYFGAIYEMINFAHYNHNGQRPPQYVIAFRGTILKHGVWKQDLKLDFNIIFNKLKYRSRFQVGLQSVLEIVQKFGPGNVWLAGHSLGSSIALVIGRHMINHTGAHLETYLFNPPFVSPPVEWIRNDELKTGIRFADSVLTAGLATAVNHFGNRQKSHENDTFTVLSTWVPYLFINQRDPICSEYAGYFKHREDMESMGAGKIGTLATKYSKVSILSGAVGKKDSEADHLIPCAYLTINTSPCQSIMDTSPCQSIMDAHAIRQWWSQDLQCVYKYYNHQ